MDRTTLLAIEAQKRRCIATILHANDQALIDDDDHARIRKTVLDAVNDLYRSTITIVEAAEEGMSVNELLIDRLSADPASTNGRH